MNGKTYIQYEEVSNKVEQIRKSSNIMESLFDDFVNIMSMIYQEDVFQGNASNTLQEKFNSLKKSFNEYVELVVEFATVIDKARKATENTEMSINRDAEELNNIM